MTDPILARAHAANVRHGQRSDQARRKACFAAAVVVGRYEKGATKSLAEDRILSVDTIEREARAAVTYLMLWGAFRGTPDSRRVRNLWHALPYGHWADAGRLWRDDMPPKDLLETLQLCADEGLSARAMSSNGHAPSILEMLDTLMARHMRAAESLPPGSQARQYIDRAVEFLRQARASAEREGIA